MRSPMRFFFVAALVAYFSADEGWAQTSPGGNGGVAQRVIEIRQRDSAERRAKTVEEVRRMLKEDATAQGMALATLQQVADIKFDRSGLDASVASLLTSPSADVRRAALLALPTLNPDGSRIDAVAKLADDPNAVVRAAVVPAIVAIRNAAKIDTPLGEPAIKLLGDAEAKVVTATAQSFWGVPLTRELEAKVIELSQFPKERIPDSGSIQYTLSYYVLSTRPVITKPVAQRLAELARHPQLDQNWTGRAVWGLAHTPSPEAAEVITKALIEELDHSLRAYNREWAVRGLANLKTEAARDKLQEIATKDESEELRQLAAGALRR